jgi:hypothetical protein
MVHMSSILEEALAEEREACARVAENNFNAGDGFEIAAAIRAQG